MKLIRLYHTLKYLRFSQLYVRLWYRFKKLKQRKNIYTGINQSWQWHSPCFVGQCLFEGDKACFLSYEVNIASKSIWNDPNQEKLWLYNLHYFDDLSAMGADERRHLHYQLIDRWIDENPPFVGNGWEPYTLSLRLINWVKYFSRQGVVAEKYYESIAVQADALEQQLEYHLLGNHLFANAKALVFCGVFLAGDGAAYYLKKGLRLLDQQIPEQFLADGGHFELSPMYHNIMLWDLLDLINLAQITKVQSFEERIELWQEVAEKALTWMNTLAHPDGDIAFFNDAAFGIAAKPQQLLQYASDLGLNVKQISDLHVNQICNQAIVNLKQSLTQYEVSGYSAIRRGNYCLLVDHAAVGPDYLPGHAHADTLSFELSLNQERVFVNSGTSLYGITKERLRQRKTAAHNTVVVSQEDAEQDSSEVWSGFRVARRATAWVDECIDQDDKTLLSISHDGYQRLQSPVVHQRRFVCSEKNIIIEDILLGKKVVATAHFHLHPSVEIVMSADKMLRLYLPSACVLQLEFSQPYNVVDSTWHPQFGQSIASKKLMVPLQDNGLLTSIHVIENMY